MQIESQKKCPFCGTPNRNSNRFCQECGKLFNEKEPPKFEIIENLRKSLYGSISCITIFVALMLFVTIIAPIQYGLYGLIIIPIVWPLTFGLLCWGRHYLKGLSKVRRFTITDDFIEILIPNRPFLHINWSDFDSIEVTRREDTYVVPTGTMYMSGVTYIYFTLIFRGKSIEQRYEFETGKDFKNKSRKKILVALEKIATEKGKNFLGWRWRDKRRAKKAAKDKIDQ